MDELLASIVRLQGDNVVRALQGMLQQAKVALKPGNKSSRSRSTQTTSPSTAQVDKKALACSIIALLQHSCTPAAAGSTPNNNLSSLISEALTEGMRQQPWLWERLIRQHLDYLLQTPGAVDLLINSMNQLDAQVVSRSWAVLSTQLRHVDPMVLCSAPALGNFQRGALSQVSSCFRLISRDVLPNCTAGTTPATAASVAAGTTEVDITLSMHLPAALYTLLYLVGVTDQQGAPSSWSDRGCGEGAAAYTSMLLTELSSSTSVYKMLQLGSLKQRNKSMAAKNNKGSATMKSGKKAGLKETEKKETKAKDAATEKNEEEEAEEEQEPKLSIENISNIYAAMYTSTVLIEAVLTSPQLANSLPSSTDNLATASPLTKISVLLSIRWELSQLLAAAGISPGSSFSKSFSKSAPPLWSLQTCAAIIDIAITGAAASPAGQQAQSTPALTLPPAMLAHALELIQEALTSDKTTYNEDSIEFLSQLLQRVMQVQQACATGVLTPQAAVHAGPGHHMAASRKLHSLLLQEDTSGINNKNDLNKKGLSGGKSRQQSKRTGPAVHAEPKRRKKGAGGDQAGEDAVADLMRMFTAGGGASAPPGSIPKEDAALMPKAPPSLPTNAAAATGDGAPLKPERKRITPQAIHPTTLPTSALPEGSQINEVKDEFEFEDEESEDDGALNINQGGTTNGGHGHGGGGTFGRVVMASTLDMDDTAREAAWQAYIADKEKLVEMLGDSAYQEWYDEAEHPLSAHTNPNKNPNTIDTIFDAIFGGGGGANDGLQGHGNEGINSGLDGVFGSSLPQTILETSLLYPWQAALAAVLQLALSVLQIIATRTHSSSNSGNFVSSTAAVRTCCASLISIDQRKTSAAGVLKIMDPTHSRNTWLAASKGVELHPSSGAVLHLMYQLRVLLLRTSRRTSPPMLAGYLSLARFILDTAAAQEFQNSVETTTTAAPAAATPVAATSKVSWRPLQYVGYIVKSFCCYPPLLAASFNANSAHALPKLVSAGVYPFSESIPYAAGVLWLIVQSNTVGQRKRAVRPEWLLEAIPDARAHPLVAAAPFVKSAAAEELLQQLVSGGVDSAAGHDAMLTGNGDIHFLMPLIDACAAAAFCVHQEENEKHQNAEAPTDLKTRGGAHTVLLGHSKSIESLGILSSIVLNAFAASAEALATALDSTSSSTAAAAATSSSEVILSEIEARASLLGIGLEFTEIIALVASSLQSVETSARTVLPSVLERCSGVQGSCLELLRTLSEDSEIYLAAVRGLENAPVLALPPALNNEEPAEGQEEEQADDDENEEGGAQLYDKFNSDGGDDDTNASDRPELSAYERRKRLKDIRNPYLRVIVAESRRAAGDAADGELSDLEDFIVANPERDYGDFIADHFPMAQESDGEEEDSEEEEDEEAGE